MIGEYTISFISYAIPLLLVTGILIIRIDAVGFKNQGLKQEHKVSWLLGGANIALGLSLFVVKIVMK